MKLIRRKSEVTGFPWRCRGGVWDAPFGIPFEVYRNRPYVAQR